MVLIEIVSTALPTLITYSLSQNYSVPPQRANTMDYCSYYMVTLGAVCLRSKFEAA